MGMIDPGDDLSDVTALGVDGGHDVVSVVFHQSDKTVGFMDAFLCQHVAARGISADNPRIRNQFAEPFTAGTVIFYDGNFYPALHQKACQIHRAAVPAGDHHPTDRLHISAGGDKKPADLLRTAGDAQTVVFLNAEITLWDLDLSVPFGKADQNMRTKAPLKLPERNPCQPAAPGDMIFDNLRTAAGEGIHPGSPRKTECAGDVLGALVFRIKEHGNPESLSQEFRFPEIFGIPYPGDHMLCAQFTGSKTADEIDFILFGCGDKQIGLRGSGLPENVRICGTALETDDVQVIRHMAERLGIPVDDGDIVLFRGERFRKGASDPACAGNNQFHVPVPFMELSVRLYSH